MRCFKNLVAVLALGIAVAAAPGAAQAGTYNFSQIGFDDGASISGHFTGEDLNHDGKISTSELTDLWVSVSGGQLDWWSAGLGWGINGFWFQNTLTYTIGSHVLTDIYAQNRYFIYTPGAMEGITIFGGYDASAASSEPIWVIEPSPAPEPATWLMMFGGLGLVGALARRRQARA